MTSKVWFKYQRFISAAKVEKQVEKGSSPIIYFFCLPFYFPTKVDSYCCFDKQKKDSG